MYENFGKFLLIIFTISKIDFEKMIFIYFTESGKLESGGCRDTGSRNRQPAASARGNGFSVLRIF